MALLLLQNEPHKCKVFKTAKSSHLLYAGRLQIHLLYYLYISMQHTIVTREKNVIVLYEITMTASILLNDKNKEALNKYKSWLKFLRDISITSERLTHAIVFQVVQLNPGSTFGFGEEMRDRRIIALTDLQCMLIPKVWLLQKNTANIWTRIEHYLKKKVRNYLIIE